MKPLVPGLHGEVNGKQGGDDQKNQDELQKAVAGEGGSDHVHIVADQVIVEGGHNKPVGTLHRLVICIMEQVLQTVGGHSGASRRKVLLPAFQTVALERGRIGQGFKNVAGGLQMVMRRADHIAAVGKDHVAEGPLVFLVQGEMPGHGAAPDAHDGRGQRAALQFPAVDRDADQKQILLLAEMGDKRLGMGQPAGEKVIPAVLDALPGPHVPVLVHKGKEVEAVHSLHAFREDPQVFRGLEVRRLQSLGNGLDLLDIALQGLRQLVGLLGGQFIQIEAAHVVNGLLRCVPGAVQKPHSGQYHHHQQNSHGHGQYIPSLLLQTRSLLPVFLPFSAKKEPVQPMGRGIPLSQD